MTICESCIRNKDCKWNKGNPRHCTLYTDKKETNFDRITATPEALADLMYDCADCNNCPITDKSVCQYKYENCKEAWVEWLKQPHK